MNLLKGIREAALAALPDAAPTPHAPLGLRLAEGTRVEDSEAWRAGLVEVQDEGSQLISLACAAQPGERVIDMCAGAGGKTLALAADMADQARSSPPTATAAGFSGCRNAPSGPGRRLSKAA